MKRRSPIDPDAPLGIEGRRMTHGATKPAIAGPAMLNLDALLKQRRRSLVATMKASAEATGLVEPAFIQLLAGIQAAIHAIAAVEAEDRRIDEISARVSKEVDNGGER